MGRGAGWALHDSRRATLWLEGLPHHVRPPTLGELLTLAEDIDSRTEALAVAAETLPISELVAEARRGSLASLQAALDVLCGTVTITDDSPAWLHSNAAGQLGTLIHHWTTTPPTPWHVSSATVGAQPEAVRYSPTVRALVEAFIKAGWKPDDIAALELWQAATLCGPSDGALHGEALAQANAAAREGRGPRPLAAGVQASSLVGLHASRADADG